MRRHLVAVDGDHREEVDEDVLGLCWPPINSDADPSIDWGDTPLGSVSNAQLCNPCRSDTLAGSR